MLGKTLRGAAVLLVLGSGSSFAASLPATTDNVVILAQDSVTLGGRSQLNSGQIAVNNAGGVLTVRYGVHALDNTEIIADIVTVKAPLSRKAELFDIFANSFLGGDRATYHDVVSPLGASLPLFPFPSAPEVKPGTDTCPNGTGTGGNCVVRQKNGPVTLLPGDYGDISATGHGLLYLQGGVYNIKSLSIGLSSFIVVNGYATVNVQEDVSFGWFSTFGPADSINPRCVVLNVAGSHVRVSVATVSAVINAPNAAVNLAVGTKSRGAMYTGNLTGKTVRVGGGSTLQSADPLCEPCEEGGLPCTPTVRPTPTGTPTPTPSP